MSYHKIPAYAKKYGLAMEAQRGWWRDYLLRTHLAPETMLRDAIHPNQKGVALYAQFFDDYFDSLVNHWSGQTERNVVSIPFTPDQHRDGNDGFSFEGNRVELIAAKPLASFPDVSIDGSSPATFDSCYLVSRATPTPTVPDWPTIRRITLLHDHVPEAWMATVTHIAADQKSFDFSVKGSVSGSQGSGDSGHDFTASSGRLKIEAGDWMIEPAFEESARPIQGPLEVRWSVDDQCGGKPEIIDRGDGNMQYRYVLATGLPGKSHSVTLRSTANDSGQCHRVPHLQTAAGAELTPSCALKQ